MFGWLADRNENFRFFLGASVLTLCGVVSAMMPLFKTYPLMIVYSALFGMFTGERLHYSTITVSVGNVIKQTGNKTSNLTKLVTKTFPMHSTRLSNTSKLQTSPNYWGLNIHSVFTQNTGRLYTPSSPRGSLVH